MTHPTPTGAALTLEAVQEIARASAIAAVQELHSAQAPPAQTPSAWPAASAQAPPTQTSSDWPPASATMQQPSWMSPAESNPWMAFQMGRPSRRSTPAYQAPYPRHPTFYPATQFPFGDQTASGAMMPRGYRMQPYPWYPPPYEYELDY
jgi:hypothetical protein